MLTGPSHLGESLYTLISTGGTTLKGSSNPGDLLDCINDNLLSQVIEETKMKGSLMYLLLTNKEEVFFFCECESWGQPWLQ